MPARAILGCALAVLLGVPSIAGGSPACAIAEGGSIGAIRIGMTVQAALAISGAARAQEAAGGETVYTLRGPWSQMAADYGIVRRVATRAPECQTARRLGPGTASNAVRAAYSNASASLVTPLPDGGETLWYPLLGIRFVIRRERVESVEVLRSEGRRSSSQAPPASTASPGQVGTPAEATVTWVIRSTSVQVQDDVLLVSGTVENRGRVAAPYADVRAYSGAGRLVARGDGPLVPTPVPAGAAATFEVRLRIDDVVRRYTVTLRPARSLTASLAEHTGDVKNLQQFAPIVARKIQTAVEVTTNPPTRDDFVVVVTNGSPLTVAVATVSVELNITCHLANIQFPIGRNIQELRAGNVVVQQIRPGQSARTPLPLSAGVCPQFGTWSAAIRVGEVRIGE